MNRLRRPVSVLTDGLRDWRDSFRPFCSVVLTGVIFTASLAAQDVSFEQQVAPVLESRCWGCHSADTQESGLRLDTRAGMLRGGDSGLAAVVPGDVKKSYLIDAVRHLDPNVEMPPDEDPLEADQIAVLERWIQQGAVWPGQMAAVAEEETDLWSFQPVHRPDVPEIEAANPVDAFLLQKLKQRDLSFNGTAGAADLLRRLSIVLTGLPPTPQRTAQFAVDFQRDSDAAFSAAVEELLASKHFGERWAQHWLDVIRWAETNGSEANLYRKNAWMYRDYVIRSFNEDTPYDQFLREQIAGDSLGMGEATGFLVAGPHVPAATVGREPAAIRQARADRMDEIMQTVGASVLGVTIGCARCHNHKFDPVSIGDYYALTAVFQDVEFGGRHPEYSDDHPLQLRGQELQGLIAEQREQLIEFGGWEENWGAYREVHFRPVSTTAVRLKFKMRNVFIDELEVLGQIGDDRNFALASRGTVLSGHPALGFETRNPVARVNDGQYGTMVWRCKVEQGEERPWVQFEFPEPQTVGRLRLSNNREYFYDTDYLDRKPNLPRYEFDMEIRTEAGEWKPWVGTWRINTKLREQHPERQQSLDEIQRLISLLSEEGPRPGFVGRFVEPVVTRVLLRGSPERPRDEVAPAAPRVLGGDLEMTSENTGAERRLAFAEWVSDAGNPLTARVMVNRVWHHIFGRGLVTTTSDFGHAGAAPSHPELLDWLAAEFVSPTVSAGEPWSVKSLIRLLVTTEAFTQTSFPQHRAAEIDADSRLLWRYPPRRVEAEVIRDGILQASGCLSDDVGGRSFRIHNVKKTYAQWEVVDNSGPGTWRRMIYQERMRRVDDRLFTAFDFPDCGQVRAQRPVSTTPLQALNLMNSQFVLDQCQRIAARALDEANGDRDRAIGGCFQLLLGRDPAAEELQACREMISEQDLSLVCRALINSNEFAFLP